MVPKSWLSSCPWNRVTASFATPRSFVAPQPPAAVSTTVNITVSAKSLFDTWHLKREASAYLLSTSSSDSLDKYQQGITCSMRELSRRTGSVARREGLDRREEFVERRSVEQSSAKNHSAYPPRIANIFQRVGIEQQQVGALTGFDGPLRRALAKKIGGIFCGGLKRLHRRQACFHKQR